MGNFSLKATPTDNSKSIILSFDSKWDAALHNNVVSVVFRKTGPTRFLPNYMYVYLNAPTSAIIGFKLYVILYHKFIHHINYNYIGINTKNISSFLRQFISCCCIYFIPFLSCQFNLEALQISFNRFAFVVPTIGWIFAGCLKIHAIAIAVLGTPLTAAISSIFLFNHREFIII